MKEERRHRPFPAQRPACGVPARSAALPPQVATDALLRRAAHADAPPLSPAHVVQLQQAAGNRALRSLLAPSPTPVQRVPAKAGKSKGKSASLTAPLIDRNRRHRLKLEFAEGHAEREATLSLLAEALDQLGEDAALSVEPLRRQHDALAEYTDSPKGDELHWEEKVGDHVQKIW